MYTDVTIKYLEIAFLLRSLSLTMAMFLDDVTRNLIDAP